MVQSTELNAAKTPCVATCFVKNEAMAEFEELVKALVPSVRQEPGCMYYAMTKSVDQADPDHTKVVFFELYMDEAAFQTHVTRPDIAEAISGCAGLLKEGTSVVIDQLVVVV